MTHHDKPSHDKHSDPLRDHESEAEGRKDGPVDPGDAKRQGGGPDGLAGTTGEPNLSMSNPQGHDRNPSDTVGSPGAEARSVRTRVEKASERQAAGRDADARIGGPAEDRTPGSRAQDHGAEPEEAEVPAGANTAKDLEKERGDA